MNLSILSLTSLANAGQRMREDALRRARDRRRALRLTYPRREELWTEAEDRRLLRLVKKIQSQPERDYELWSKVSKALGRTTCGVQSRFYALRAGMRLASCRRRRA